MKKTRRIHVIAALLMIASSLGFSLMQMMIKITGANDRFPLMEQVFFRNLVTFIGMLLVLRPNTLAIFGKKADQPLLFGRSICGFLAVIAFFYATNNSNIADANILNKLSPVFVTVLAFFFLKEKISAAQIVSLAITLLGAWLVCGPSFKSAPLPIIMALFSALSSGFAYFFISAMKNRTESLTIIFHFSCLSTLVSALLMLPHFVIPTVQEFFGLLLIGVFGSVGQFGLTYSYKLASASEMSIYTYSSIIWSGLLGVQFLGEGLSMSSIVGGSLVILASALVFISNHRQLRLSDASEKEDI